MNMYTAIALSNGNKAVGYSRNGGRIVVQQRYQGRREMWYYIWCMRLELQFPCEEEDDIVEMLDREGCDPESDDWQPI